MRLVLLAAGAGKGTSRCGSRRNIIFLSCRRETCCARLLKPRRRLGSRQRRSWIKAPCAGRDGGCIVADRIGAPDAKTGFILDGFPRTVGQAEALAKMLRAKNMDLDAVIELKVDEAALLARIAQRVKTRLRAVERCVPTTTPRRSKPGSTPTTRRQRRFRLLCQTSGSENGRWDGAGRCCHQGDRTDARGLHSLRRLGLRGFCLHAGHKRADGGAQDHSPPL